MNYNNKYIAWGITLAAVGGIMLLNRRKQTTPSLIKNNGGMAMNNYFADKEFAKSTTADKYGLTNEPSAEAWYNLHALRDNILNPAREALGYPIYITSGYRSGYLNSLVGGASNSQHTTGKAVDITAKNLARNRELFAILVQMGNFDQLIWEKGGEWIHVSYSPGGNRGQILAYNGKAYININNNWQGVINL